MGRITHVLTVLISLSLLLLLPLPAAGHTVGTPNSPCYVIPYVTDNSGEQSHYSLVVNNSISVGTYLRIETDCGERFSVVIDGQGAGHNYSLFEGVLELSTKSIEIIGYNDSFNIKLNNLTFFPAGTILDGIEDNSDSGTLSSEDIFWDELLAHGITFIILYLMSTSVVYKIARYRVDRAVDVIV